MDDQKIQIKGNLENRGGLEYASIILTYSSEVLSSPSLSTRLSAAVVQEYERLCGDPPGPGAKTCILEIHATVASSQIVKAIYSLFKTVRAYGGRLYCIGYPDKYIIALTALGLTSMEGFGLFDRVSDALDHATGR